MLWELPPQFTSFKNNSVENKRWENIFIPLFTWLIRLGRDLSYASNTMDSTHRLQWCSRTGEIGTMRWRWCNHDGVIAQINGPQVWDCVKNEFVWCWGKVLFVRSSCQDQAVVLTIMHFCSSCSFSDSLFPIFWLLSCSFGFFHAVYRHTKTGV